MSMRTRIAQSTSTYHKICAFQFSPSDCVIGCFLPFAKLAGKRFNEAIIHKDPERIFTGTLVVDELFSSATTSLSCKLYGTSIKSPSTTNSLVKVVYLKST